MRRRLRFFACAVIASFVILGGPWLSLSIAQSGDPLRVRSQPAGTQIGLIPDGWAVRVLEWSRNGYWVKVTSHFGFDPGEFGFGSAPDFAEGWVSAGFVKDEGRHCFKPGGVGQIVQPEVFGAAPVEVQGDWLAMADALAE